MAYKVKRNVLFVIALFLCAMVVGIDSCTAWSNGGKSNSESDPDYGTHDQFAKYGMTYVKQDFPHLVTWLEEDLAEYYYWTEVPDMVYQDWTNHNYDFGDYGYCGGPPDRGGPQAVQNCYDWTVGNLTLWVGHGQPAGSEYASDARKSMGLLVHYLSDLSNPMHTDDDATDSGKEHEDYSGRIGNYMYRMSYHSCHEKATDRALEAYEYEFNAIRPDVTQPLQNDNAHDEALWCAEFANMGADRTGRTTGYEGQDVGDHYQEFLEEIVYGFTNKICTTHHGITVEGTTDQLYAWNVEVMQLGASSIGRIIYHASTEAGVTDDGGGEPSEPGTMYVSDISWEKSIVRGRYPRTDLECFVTILDTSGNPVDGAEVTIDWAHPDGTVITLTATTDASGVASFVQQGVQSGTHTVTVVDVVKTDWVYDSSLNVETTDSYEV